VPLHDNETRKRAFGAYAEEYDAVRPRYQAAVVAAVAEHARLSAASRALEIGSGTGIATLPFAEMGCSIRCLELSEAMATVARRKLARFPRVTVETTRFEDWAAEDGTFDLVFCAQAWHWLTPEVRYAKTRQLLRPGGTLAVFANWASSVLEAVQPAYRKHFAGAPAPAPGGPWRPAGPGGAFEESHPPDIDGDVAEVRRSIETSGCYEAIEIRRFLWQRSFRAEEYVRLLRTYSDHATLPADIREPLLRDIAAAIDAAGGVVTRTYEAVLLLARPAK
jgi:SAM-dependent methyltransferase